MSAAGRGCQSPHTPMALSEEKGASVLLVGRDADNYWRIFCTHEPRALHRQPSEAINISDENVVTCAIGQGDKLRRDSDSGATLEGEERQREQLSQATDQTKGYGKRRHQNQRRMETHDDRPETATHLGSIHHRPALRKSPHV